MSNTDLALAVQSVARHVWSVLGVGHIENTYHQAMLVGLRKRGIEYDSERWVSIHYLGHCVGSGRADIVVGDPSSHQSQIVVELKAEGFSVAGCSPASAQLYRYMNDLEIPFGLLINFMQPRSKSKCAPELEILEATL